MITPSPPLDLRPRQSENVGPEHSENAGPGHFENAGPEHDSDQGRESEQFANTLQEPAITREHWGFVEDFYTQLAQVRRQTCADCKENWFDLKLVNGVCDPCRRRARSGKPKLYTVANNADVGTVPEQLPELTQIEEQLIARVHVHLQVWQVKGQQYKYKSYVVNFMQNTSKVYNKLPLLPEDLNVSYVISLHLVANESAYTAEAVIE